MEPTQKQLDYCYQILERIGSCPCNEDGEVPFETSVEEADKFIKAHTTGQKWEDREVCSAGDWGIPNH